VALPPVCRAYDSNFCFDIWRVTNADYLLTYLLRPTSLTCVACKIMERIIVDQMTDHLMQNGVLNKAQHGFFKGLSTCSNLLKAFNDWTLSLNDRHGVTVA